MCVALRWTRAPRTRRRRARRRRRHARGARPGLPACLAPPRLGQPALHGRSRSRCLTLPPRSAPLSQPAPVVPRCTASGQPRQARGALPAPGRKHARAERPAVRAARGRRRARSHGAGVQVGRSLRRFGDCLLLCGQRHAAAQQPVARGFRERAVHPARPSASSTHPCLEPTQSGRHLPQPDARSHSANVPLSCVPASCCLLAPRVLPRLASDRAAPSHSHSLAGWRPVEWCRAHPSLPSFTLHALEVRLGRGRGRGAAEQRVEMGQAAGRPALLACCARHPPASSRIALAPCAAVRLPLWWG